MKHIDQIKLSALADNEYALSEIEAKHLKECEECGRVFMEMKSIKKTIQKSKITEDIDFEIAIDYNHMHKNKKVFQFTYKMSFLFLFLISFFAGIIIAGQIKNEDNFLTKRNEFNEMGSKYAEKQYVFPFK